jgi:PAS domain S-box-containing protein
MNCYSRNFNLFLENIGTAAIIFGVDSVVTACNSASEKLFGQAAGGLVGRKLAELDLQLVDIDGCPESKDGFPINKIAGNTENNKATQLDFGLRFPFTESTEWFRATLQPIFENDGERSSLVFTFTGITDLVADKKTQNQIFLAKSEWETTVDAIPDILTIQDREMGIVRANKAAHDLFGYTLGELKGRKCYEVFHKKEIPCAGCPVNRTRKDHCSHTGTIYNEILDKSFSISSFPIYDRQGKMHQLVHVARDITREELLEQQLHQGMKMEALGTLAGGIAHDFNNILSAMIGYGEIAKGRLPLEHPARKDLDQVIAGGDRAVDLVKQILTFSRRESYGQFRLFKLQYIIKEVIKLLRPSLPATIELQHEIDNSCRSVFADSGQIYQVLINLCTNARQSIGDGHGCITIKLSEMKAADQLVGGSILQERSGVFLDLEVSDTGCGIEEDMLDKIFDPFFSTKKKEQGTGLGLAVVHGIIKKHKGEIHVASKVGVGTTVHIYLAADGGEVDNRKVKASLKQGGNERIMVIDDEPPVARVLQSMLQRVGYNVTIFNDSIAAVKRFRMDPNCCDLVITDMLMPNMTGVELAREFLGQRSDIPIIILSGHSENVDRKRVKQLGIKELLLKPIKKEKLYQIIRRILEHGKNFDHR